MYFVSPRSSCMSQSDCQPPFSEHTLWCHTLIWLISLFCVCSVFTCDGKEKCNFQGGVCDYNFLILCNIRPDQLTCTDEQVHNIREENTYNQLSYNGNGKSKCMFLFRYLYQIHLFYSSLDYEVKSVSLRTSATTSDSLSDIERPHVKPWLIVSTCKYAVTMKMKSVWTDLEGMWGCTCMSASKRWILRQEKGNPRLIDWFYLLCFCSKAFKQRKIVRNPISKAIRAEMFIHTYRCLFWMLNLTAWIQTGRYHRRAACNMYSSHASYHSHIHCSDS